MNHRQSMRRLNRTASHRKALWANMMSALIKHEQITTTLPKAKELRRVIDPDHAQSFDENVKIAVIVKRDAACSAGEWLIGDRDGIHERAAVEVVNKDSGRASAESDSGRQPHPRDRGVTPRKLTDSAPPDPLPTLVRIAAPGRIRN